MPISVATPQLIEKEEFLWEGFKLEDIPEVIALFHQVNEHDGEDFVESPEDLRQQYEDALSDPRKDARVARNLTGRIVAFLRVFLNPKPQQQNVRYLLRAITKEARAQGLEQDALEWMEERAEARTAEVAESETAGALPRTSRASFTEQMREPIGLYTAHGYEHVRTFYKMERSLDEPIPGAPLPAGLKLVTYTPELDEKVFAADNEAFRDHWGHEEMSREDWKNFVINTSDARPDLTLVALDGDEVAGFCINAVRTIENQRLGIHRGWVQSLGTRRAWRKRGIARALQIILLLSMTSMVAFGLAWNFGVALLVLLALKPLRGMNYPLATAWMNQHIESSVRATVFSIRNQADALGQILGGPILGVIATLVSLRAEMIVAALFLLPAFYLCARRTGLPEPPLTQAEASLP